MLRCAVARRILSVAIAMAIVVARVLAGGGAARASPTAPVIHGAMAGVTSVGRPLRTTAGPVRSLRLTADDIGAIAEPVRADEPVRTLAPASVVEPAPERVVAPAPPPGARAPPR